MNENIILIGPLAAGKSSIALKLSELSGLNNYPIDRLKWYYRFKNGYNLQEGTEILKSKGFGELIKYADRYFGVAELKEILTSFNGIMDLGATDTYCEGLSKRHTLKEFFDPFPNVFLILPTDSDKKNIEILTERIIKRYANHEFKDLILSSYLEKNAEFLLSPSNYVLAKHIIYTEGRSMKEVATEVLLKCKFKEYERTVANL